MSSSSNLSSCVIGLALFSMFFGGGNLIFPLFVGHLAEDQWFSATIGFLITTAAVPFLGVIAMVMFRGDYNAFFGCLGKPLGFLVTLVLLVVWIPLGSAPRCITLAYASLALYVPDAPPLWVFSIAYCIVVTLIINKKNRMIDILGYVLTPLLLLCLGLIVFKGIDLSSDTLLLSSPSFDFLFFGLKEGYNTMDLIASFFFSASIIEILRKVSKDDASSLKKTLKASVLGVILLGLVYIGLILLASNHAEELQHVPKDRLLVHIAHTVLGPRLGIIAALAVFFACISTSIALISVFADFLAVNIFGNSNKYPLAIAISQVMTFGMSIFGLQGITAFTGPILQVFYPFLLVLIVFNVGKRLIARNRSEIMIGDN